MGWAGATDYIHRDRVAVSDLFLCVPVSSAALQPSSVKRSDSQVMAPIVRASLLVQPPPFQRCGNRVPRADKAGSQSLRLLELVSGEEASSPAHTCVQARSHQLSSILFQ